MSAISNWGGYHPAIVPPEIEDWLGSQAFYRKLQKMKVGQTFKVPFLLNDRVRIAVQARVQRLTATRTTELRTTSSKKTGDLFIIRTA